MFPGLADLDITYWYSVPGGHAHIFFFDLLYTLLQNFFFAFFFVFFYTILSFENKDDGARSSHVRDVRCSGVTEALSITSATKNA